MKGDFSRDTFDKKKRYARVLMQQGRVQLDADWNEQQAITQNRVETEAADVIGSNGAPLDEAGFHIVDKVEDLKIIPQEASLPGNKSNLIAKAGDFLISAGRFYVDGILCENETIVHYTGQPDLPNTQPLTMDYTWFISMSG